MLIGKKSERAYIRLAVRVLMLFGGVIVSGILESTGTDSVFGYPLSTELCSTGYGPSRVGLGEIYVTLLDVLCTIRKGEFAIIPIYLLLMILFFFGIILEVLLNKKKKQ